MVDKLLQSKTLSKNTDLEKFGSKGNFIWQSNWGLRGILFVDWRICSTLHESRNRTSIFSWQMTFSGTLIDENCNSKLWLMFWCCWCIFPFVLFWFFRKPKMHKPTSTWHQSTYVDVVCFCWICYYNFQAKCSSKQPSTLIMLRNRSSRSKDWVSSLHWE